MKIPEKFMKMKKDKKMLTAVTALGISGLLLIMISSLIPEKKQPDESAEINQMVMTDAESYCSETEKRLEEFLKNIEGAGDVRVYLKVGSNEKYVYATEGKRSRSENKTEEEEKYVIIGGGSEKSALIETIEAPAIEGAVIACSGCDSPIVQEQIYRAVSAALGIPTGKIYVTKLK
ncbi:MAG: hypothetical protein J6L05_02875 [Ruminococcus sp.]|nr:hypothetical protein [Ruminococcus sp.]